MINYFPYVSWCFFIPTPQDAAGRETSVVQQFSLDGSIPDLLKVPQFLLLTDFRSLVCSDELVCVCVGY